MKHVPLLIPNWFPNKNEPFCDQPLANILDVLVINDEEYQKLIDAVDLITEAFGKARDDGTYSQ